MNVAGKRVLIIGVDCEVAATIFDNLDSGNQPVTGIKSGDVDWGDYTEVLALLETHDPFLTVNFIGSPLFTHKPQHSPSYLIAAIKNISAACTAVNAVVIHTSDYHVFGDDKKNAYLEKDPVSPLDNYGEAMVAIEQCFQANLEKILILRFSWIININTKNILTKTLEGLINPEGVVLTPYRRGAPTWQDDIVRVINAVIRQVISGAMNWGVFHYCSADTCNELEFGQHVQAVFSELFEGKGDITGATAKIDTESSVAESPASANDEAVDVGEPLEPTSAALSCTRIKNNFGVHSRSWRQGLQEKITQWAEEKGLERSEVVSVSDVTLKK